MPDALDLLAAQNRIAKAIEDKTPTINVAAANPAITIAPPPPTINVAPPPPTINVAPPPPTINVTFDVAPIVEAINNLQINSGGSSFDCNCLALVLKPVVDAINNLRQDVICVIAPVAAGVVQIQKSIAYYTEDGPHLGLDAPPGSFIFPKPSDTSPPPNQTPDRTPIDNGGWTAPPIVEGVAYTSPPGGIQGATNPTSYNNYKCDAAVYITRYLRAWYEAIAATYNVWSAAETAYGIVEALVVAVNYAMTAGATGTATIVYNAATGVTLVKAGAATGVTLVSFPILILVGLVLISLQALNLTISVLTADYLTMYNSRKNDIICALYKARTIEEARSKVKGILGQNPVQISYWYDKIADYVLSDALLSHLFACHPDFDPATIAGLGQLEGGCVACSVCDDAEEEIALNLPTETSWTTEYEFGNRSVDLICITVKNTFSNQSPRVYVYLNEKLACVKVFGSATPTKVLLTPPWQADGEWTNHEDLDPNAHLYTKWVGNIKIIVSAPGTIGAGYGTVNLSGLAWRNA